MALFYSHVYDFESKNIGKKSIIRLFSKSVEHFFRLRQLVFICFPRHTLEIFEQFDLLLKGVVLF